MLYVYVHNIIIYMCTPLGDKQYQISRGENFHELYLVTLIDR